MKLLSILLAAYDEQLRTAAETSGAVTVRLLGPLHLATFAQGRGFITYRSLDGLDASTIRSMVSEALVHYRADASIKTVEWKSRAHDHAPELHETLVGHGFVAGERESIMVGETQSLITDAALPQGVTLRRVESGEEIKSLAEMQAEVFGNQDAASIALDLTERLTHHDGTELWTAEFRGRVVCSGRLEFVRGTAFAGIWGGATRSEWRGQGIYRALTAARARSALAAGKTLIHSDSTEYSRPILERAGLLKVSETTPYVFERV